MNTEAPPKALSKYQTGSRRRRAIRRPMPSGIRALTREYTMKHSILIPLVIAAMLSGFGCTDNPNDALHISGADGDAEATETDGDVETADGDTDETADIDIIDGDTDEESVAETETVEIVDYPLTGWEGVTITANAPDDTTVKVVFSRNPGEADCTNQFYYVFSADVPLFDIEDINYDAATATALITTSRQPLGIEYTLTMLKGDNPSDSFLSADTKTFWVTDFSSSAYDQYQITTNRVAVSDTSVAYVEQGYNFPGITDIVGEFDDMIFPVETQLLQAAPDMDGNGRIVFVGLDGGDYYGGYFSQINAYSDAQTMSWWGLHSNEMEMIHVNVLVDAESVGHVVAHEFQHLLYHARHGMNQQYWEYHDEGLAESAVRIVYGSNDYAVEFYQWDYQDIIGGGLSLVNWNYGLYENYALAYLWWAYVTGQLGEGIDGYSTIFDMNVGSPEEVDAFTTNNFGLDFPTMYMNNLIANWVQDQSGLYSYNGALSFAAGTAPTAARNVQSVDIDAFAGTFFRLNQETVSYPGTQGETVVYAGIDPQGNVDLEEPFTVDGGALLVYNKTLDYEAAKVHSGPDLAQTGGAQTTKNAPLCGPKNLQPWMDPPPINPGRAESFDAWKQAAEQRMAH